VNNEIQKPIIISHEAFIRNPDGSWTSTRNTDIQTPDGSIRIGPGMVFYKNKRIWGVNIVKILDENHE